MGAAELAGAIQNWPGRVPVRNSVTSIIEAAASYNFSVADDVGEAAFRLDDDMRRLEFSSSAISALRRASSEIAEEVRPNDGSFAADMCKLGDRLFTFHELTHVAQNAGDFQTIQHLKQLSKLQVAQLDLIADLAAVQAAACIDCVRNGSTSPKFFAAACVRIGVFAFALGVRAFGVRDEIKRARFLGLLMTSAATHALNDDKLLIPWLCDGSVSPPILPVLTPSGEFNAMVLQPAPKLLLARSRHIPEPLARDLCGDLSAIPANRAMSCCYAALMSAGVIGANFTAIPVNSLAQVEPG
jgi:hypothetical protein